MPAGRVWLVQVTNCESGKVAPNWIGPVAPYTVHHDRDMAPVPELIAAHVWPPLMADGLITAPIVGGFGWIAPTSDGDGRFRAYPSMAERREAYRRSARPLLSPGSPIRTPPDWSGRGRCRRSCM